ncbi:MAG TPA: hypothetical protein VGL99_19645 [Chloroflexota bacterium]
MRRVSSILLVTWPIVLASLLVLGTTAFADEEDETPPAETPEMTGPALALRDAAPIACDPSEGRQRYLEVRGAGFDAWALQRLPGSVLDASGAQRMTWSSIWVSPRGQLTLEIGLCSDPSRRPRLDPGSYTLVVGAPSSPIASTSIELSAPPEPASDADVETVPDVN